MTKSCSLCRQELPTSEFYVSKAGNLHCWCRACSKRKHAEDYAKHRDKRLGANRKNYAANRDVRLATQRARRPEIKERDRIAFAANPAKFRARERQSRLKSRYGITQERYDELYAEQLGCCAICGKSGEKLVVDHNHGTGRVRGLLCYNCNLGLGLLGDSVVIVAAANNYLIKHHPTPPLLHPRIGNISANTDERLISARLHIA
jgi:hypothetical protein